MYDYLLQMIVFVSLGFLIFLMARAVPRLLEETETAGGKVNYFDRLVKKLPLAKIDAFLNLYFGKVLRRLKVVVLKVDNLLNSHLSRMKKPEEKAKDDSTKSLP